MYLDFGLDSATIVLQIEQSFTSRHLGTDMNVAPYDDPEGAREVAELIEHPISDARASEDGALSITFANGDMLVVPPHLRFEAWNLVSSSGLRLVAAPGHGLVTWSATSGGYGPTD